MVGSAYKKSVKPTISKHFFCKLFGQTQKKPYLCIAFRNKARAFSSAGLEHLPYKQRVGAFFAIFANCCNFAYTLLNIDN